MLKHRLLSGILIALAFIAAVFFLSSFWAVMVLLVVSFMAAWEFYSMLEAAKIPHFKILGAVGCVLLIALTAWTLTHPAIGIAAAGESVALFLLIAGVFIRQFPQKNNPRPLETMAGTLMGILYAGFLFNFFGVGGKKRNKKQANTWACRLLYSFILVVSYYWIMKLWPMLGV